MKVKRLFVARHLRLLDQQPLKYLVKHHPIMLRISRVHVGHVHIALENTLIPTHVPLASVRQPRQVRVEAEEIDGHVPQYK
jgi:hypothetical protein